MNPDIVDEHALCALVAKLRETGGQLAGLTDAPYLIPTLAEAADLIDSVVAGRTGVDQVQGAIDRVNEAFDRRQREQRAAAEQAFEEAAASSDPDDWRDALSQLILTLDDDEVEIAMQMFAAARDAMAAQELLDMRVEGRPC